MPNYERELWVLQVFRHPNVAAATRWNRENCPKCNESFQNEIELICIVLTCKEGDSFLVKMPVVSVKKFFKKLDSHWNPVTLVFM